MSHLSLADRRDWSDFRGNWPLARNQDRSWWHPHTGIKLFWPQPIAPWTADHQSMKLLLTSLSLSLSLFLTVSHALSRSAVWSHGSHLEVRESIWDHGRSHSHLLADRGERLSYYFKSIATQIHHDSGLTPIRPAGGLFWNAACEAMTLPLRHNGRRFWNVENLFYLSCIWIHEQSINMWGDRLLQITNKIYEAYFTSFCMFLVILWESIF